MMARRIKVSQIKKNLTYSIIEAAEELGVSIATIRNWIKKGLPIQKDQRPYLIYGDDLREFIAQRREAKTFSLQDGELSCFTCNAGRRPLNGVVTYTPQTIQTGRLNGVCSVCGGKCARIISNAKINVFSQLLKIQFGDGGAP
ncbi:MAG: helix-turn-helix domain-containing protein [Rhizobiaceae bacterium]